MLWRVMADIVVAVHAAYVAIVVVGFAAILIGSAAQWRWVRNFYFRAAHLAMVLHHAANFSADVLPGHLHLQQVSVDSFLEGRVDHD